MQACTHKPAHTWPQGQWTLPRSPTALHHSHRLQLCPACPQPPPANSAFASIGRVGVWEVGMNARVRINRIPISTKEMKLRMHNCRHERKGCNVRCNECKGNIKKTHSY
eukprot:scaffold8607_cov25-Tisochrysis_lutea.AAC.1